MSFRKVANEQDVWAGEMAGVVVDGRKLLLVNVDGQLFAYEDRCAHRAVPLSKGRLCGRVLTCWAHEWQYDACTGQGLNPTGVAIRRFATKIVDQAIWVDLEGSHE